MATRFFSVSYGVSGKVGSLWVTVKDGSGNILVARTNAGFVDAGGGQYVVSVPNWAASWGADVVVDDGTISASEWYDPTGNSVASGGTNEVQRIVIERQS